MTFDSAKQIEDSDFCNVIQDIADVAHHTAATPTKARRGIRSNHVSDLEKAKRNLKEDMHSLLTSPHANLQAQPALEISGDAITALRSLWAVLQDTKNVAPEEASPEEIEETLKAAVRRAVTSLDPAHTFTEEEVEAAEDKKSNPSVPKVDSIPANTPHHSSQADAPQERTSSFKAKKAIR